jgi:DNA-binding MarR family transcriptional regulator
MANSSSSRSSPSEGARSTPRAATVAPVPGGLDDGRLKELLGYNLSRADIRLRKFFHRHMASVALRPVEYSVLVLIAANARIKQKQLGEALEISAPNLAVLLDRLAERGLVRRVRSPEDRRAQHLHLTAAGKALVATAEQLALAMEGEVLAALTPQERTQLAALLQKLAQLPL